MRPGAALARQAREFFFANLVGVYNWDNVKISPPEEHPEHDGRRVLTRDSKILADSKHREMVRIVFRPWELLISSSEEHPPCGQIVLRFGDVAPLEVVSGPIDQETWLRVRAAILDNQTRNQREMKYGYR